MRLRLSVMMILLLCALQSPAAARPIVADLAIRSIDIDHDFTGIDILLFGARNDVGDIVVVVRGPQKPYMVRKKERIFGIWTNVESVRFENVNEFYSVAATKPLSMLKNAQLLRTLSIGAENMHLVTAADAQKTAIFQQALVRQKKVENLYTSELRKISFWGETLFRTVLKFPKNIPRGWYTVEIYLFNDGLISALQTTPIYVSKIGFEAFVFDAAHRYPVIYGLVAVMVALGAGLIASWIFRRVS